MFARAVQSRAISESPTDGLKQLRPERPIREAPSADQVKALLVDIRSQPYNSDAHKSGDLVEFMALAGIGTAECANLLWRHVDFALKRITLYRKKTDTGFTIPMFPQIVPLLERMRDRINPKPDSLPKYESQVASSEQSAWFSPIPQSVGPRFDPPKSRARIPTGRWRRFLGVVQN